jgi:hypothetical protein
MAIAAIARRIGKKPGSVTWLLRRAGLKGDPGKGPTDPELNDAAHDPARSFRRTDLAFQRAMQRAIAKGREHPPMIGVFKDERPLEAPRLFEPALRSSGCTSSALMCAELEAEPIDTPSPARPEAASPTSPV